MPLIFFSFLGSRTDKQTDRESESSFLNFACQAPAKENGINRCFLGGCHRWLVPTLRAGGPWRLWGSEIIMRCVSGGVADGQHNERAHLGPLRRQRVDRLRGGVPGHTVRSTASRRPAIRRAAAVQTPWC